MPELRYKNINQKDAYTTPWTKREALLIRIWEVIWLLTISWNPKCMYKWNILLLKLFGSKIHGKPFIAPTCKIYAPWLLEIEDKACLATRTEVYNLGPIYIGKRATIAQYAYLCNGTHDLCDSSLPLMVGYMHIDEDVFIGAKSLILPGLKLRKGCVIGAGSVLTKDTDEWKIYGGNPACY